MAADFLYLLFRKSRARRRVKPIQCVSIKRGCFTSDFLGQNNPTSKHIIVRMGRSTTEVFEAVQKLAVPV